MQQNPKVIGVIGTLNSPCALAALPELNRAPGGALAMVSPSNSFVGLTRLVPVYHPSLPAALYPTGVRNYVRVNPTDDLQGAALALFARDRGRKRVFVLDDGDPGYGGLMATGFETASRRLGLDVVGRASWNPRADDYASIASASRALGRQQCSSGGLSTRMRLESSTISVLVSARGGSHGAGRPTPFPLLVDQAGDAALGVYVSVGGILTGACLRLRHFSSSASAEPRRERRSSHRRCMRLRRRRCFSRYRRSDGTRASVVEELFRTHVRGGLLGSFEFDLERRHHGEPDHHRACDSERRGSRVIDRVVRPQASLVR